MSTTHLLFSDENVLCKCCFLPSAPPPPYTLIIGLLGMHSNKIMFRGQPKCHGTLLSPSGSTVIPTFFPFIITLGVSGIHLLFVPVCRWSEKSFTKLL